MKRILKLALWLSLLYSETVWGQYLYPTSGFGGVQTATLENIMLLQNVRDRDFQCSFRQPWFVGYGSGGSTRGVADHFDGAGTTTQESMQYDRSIGGFLLGMTRSFRSDLQAGLFFSYNVTQMEDTRDHGYFHQSQKINMNQFFWGGYMRKDFWNNTYFLGTAATGYGHLDEQVEYTQLCFGNDRGESCAWRAFLYGELGKNFYLGQTLLQPFWGLQYYYNRFGEITFENDNGNAPLAFTGLTTASFRNILGIRVARNVSQFQNGFLKLECMSFWYHEFLSEENMGEIGILGTSERVSAMDSGRDWAVIAPTVTWRVGRMRLWGGYIVMFNRDESINLGQGGLSLCF